MHKKLRISLSVLMAFVMLASVVCITSISAGAVTTQTSAAGISSGDYQFYYVDSDGNYVKSGGTVCITKYTGKASTLTIPSKIKGKNVTHLGVYAFSNNTKLKSVTIPSSVKVICQGAFAGCKSLKTIKIPASTVDITSDSFDGTAWYNSKPNGVVYAGKVALDYKGSMPKNKSIAIKSGTKAISHGAFMNEENLKSITIPNTVQSIGFMSFYNCTGLTSIKIPNSVTNIAQASFWNCTNLKSITFSGCAKIGFDAFANTAWYKKQPNGVIYLGKAAYEYKGSMPKNTSITIKSGTTVISNTAFDNCKNLKSVTIPNSVKYIQVCAFSSCTNLKSITIPNSVKEIGRYALGYYFDEPTFSYKKISGFKITGGKGTAAEKYAKSNGFKFSTSTSSDTYKITYVLNGGKNDSANPSTYKKTSSTITLKNPTRAGYTFKGWYTDKSFKSSSKVTQIAKGSKGNKTLYAKWSANTYKISYVLNGGKNNSSNPEIYKVTSSTITLNNPTRTGYTFKGWYTDKSFKSSSKVTQIAKGSKGNKTLYAKWSANTYKISYVLNGGKNNSSNPEIYKVTSSTITLNNPTRTGYTFKGWYTDKSFKSSSKVTQIAKGSTGNKTLYAKWEVIKVTSISLNKKSLSLRQGDLAALTATVKNKGGLVSWSSSKPYVATVDKNGKIRTYLTGETTITVKAKNGSAAAVCKVKVTQGLKQNYTITYKELTDKRVDKGVAVSQWNQMEIENNGQKSTVFNAYMNGQWFGIEKAENTKITTSFSGTFKFKDIGIQPKVTLKWTKEKETSQSKYNLITRDMTAGEYCSFYTRNRWHEYNVTVERTITSTDTKEVLLKDICTSTIKNPLPASPDDYKWFYSTNREQLGSHLGTSAYLQNQQIPNNKVKASNMFLNYSQITLKSGNGLNLSTPLALKAYIYPTEADNKALKWESSDPSVATVTPDGIVYAKSIGTATIKCTVQDGSNTSAYCKVIVQENTKEYNISASELTVNRKSTRCEVFGDYYTDWIRLTDIVKTNEGEKSAYREGFAVTNTFAWDVSAGGELKDILPGIDTSFNFSYENQTYESSAIEAGISASGYSAFYGRKLLKHCEVTEIITECDLQGNVINEMENKYTLLAPMQPPQGDMSKVLRAFVKDSIVDLPKQVLS
ncbi:MAG: leucine-rich repeat protein [Acutalibacteraceae bacterium]